MACHRRRYSCMRGRTIAVAMATMVAACGGDDTTVLSGTVPEFCAAHVELETTYAGAPPEVATVGEMAAALSAAIADYERLPVPPEIEGSVRASLSAIQDVVEDLEDLDPSIVLDKPTIEQQEQMLPIAQRMADAEASAASIREFAESNCSKATGSTTSTTGG